MAWHNRAQSCAVRHKGPMLSRVGSRGKTPVLGSKPKVGLRPVRPQKDAGIRTEPPVSEPRAAGASPAATATPEPEDDPPGRRWISGSQGLTGVP